MDDVLWTPSPERIEATALSRFARQRGIDPTDYAALWQWSVHDLAGFWEAATSFCGLRWAEPPDAVLEWSGEHLLDSRWFVGGRLSVAEHLLTPPPTADPEVDVAVIAADESGRRERVTWADLRRRAGQLRRALSARGVGRGDRVAALLPNREESVVALLATDQLEATFSSCSPDFGPMGIVDRFGQIEPTVLVVCDGYRYNGVARSIGETVGEVVRRIDGLQLVVVVPVLGDGLAAADVAGRNAAEPDGPGPDVVEWDALLAEGRRGAGDAGDEEAPARPADAPLAILYSSGTTGPPKSIVHSCAGTLAKHLVEQRLHCDMGPDSTVMWFTTCGWMMWNWLVSALACSSTVVLYDGSPSSPDASALWRLAAELGVTHFGTSPRFLAACEAAGLVPREEADLSGLQAVLSTGAPLNPDQFDWVYANVADDVQLASVSGGTDLIGCFAGGVPTLPVRRGELQARVLGMAVEAWDERGRPVIGGKGELVCTEPFPSMPIGFWGDDDGSRYRDAYFSAHSGVWTHGDLIEIRPHGGVVVYGRSDTTLNPGGVRIGTAELYRAVEPMPEVVDAVAVGRPVGGDTEIVLFVVLAEDVDLDEELTERIRDRVRRDVSPRHVPRRVVQVSAVPYTLSGKKVEKAVLATLLGEPVRNTDAMANPEVLDEYAAVQLS